MLFLMLAADSNCKEPHTSTETYCGILFDRNFLLVLYPSPAAVLGLTVIESLAEKLRLLSFILLFLTTGAAHLVLILDYQNFRF